MEGGWAQMVQEVLVSLLVAMVSSAIKRVRSFTSNLNGLQSTLNSVNNGAIDNIEIFSINRPRQETEQFASQVAEANQLWRRCSAVSKWNIFVRCYYSDKLSSCNTTLSRNLSNHTAVLRLPEVRRELQETSPDVGVGAEVEEGDEGNRSAEMDDDETPHYHASEIEIVISDGN